MPDTWHEMLRAVRDVEPPLDLLPRIERREAMLPSNQTARRQVRLVPWVAAGIACLGILGLLILAAHSRRDTPSQRANTPPTVNVNPSTVRVRATVVGGTPELRSAIRRALAGMGNTMITRVTVVPADKTYHPVPPGGVVLHFSVQREKPRGLSLALVEWQAELVAQAARDTAIEQGLSPIVFFTALGGERVYAKDVLPQFRTPNPSDLVDRVVGAARSVGASVRSVAILRPRGLAVQVDLSVSNPRAFLRHDWETFTDRAFPTDASLRVSVIDGWFVRIRSGGVVYFAQSRSNRGPWGGISWRSPLLRQKRHS